MKKKELIKEDYVMPGVSVVEFMEQMAVLSTSIPGVGGDPYDNSDNPEQGL